MANAGKLVLGSVLIAALIGIASPVYAQVIEDGVKAAEIATKAVEDSGGVSGALSRFGWGAAHSEPAAAGLHSVVGPSTYLDSQSSLSPLSRQNTDAAIQLLNHNTAGQPSALGLSDPFHPTPTLRRMPLSQHLVDEAKSSGSCGALGGVVGYNRGVKSGVASGGLCRGAVEIRSGN